MNQWLLGLLFLGVIVLIVGKSIADVVNNNVENNQVITETITENRSDAVNMMPLPDEKGVEVAPIEDNNEQIEQVASESINIEE